jgi:hypothetical protein
MVGRGARDGAQVARADWRFANRDPAKDHTRADYDAARQ